MSRARRIECISNLHQIGIGLQLYTEDFGRYPPWGAISGNTSSNDWDFLLFQYTGGDRALFLCPALQLHPRWTNLLIYNPGYGYNALGTQRIRHLNSHFQSLGLDGQWPSVFKALPVSRVLDPSDMIGIGDCPQTKELHGQFQQYQDGDIAGALDDPDDYVASRHDGGGNVLFCDDHVEYGKQTNWMRATDGARARWDNDHQSHPETWH